VCGVALAAHSFTALCAPLSHALFITKNNQKNQKKTKHSTPNLVQRKAVLAMVAKPLAALASKGVVHGALAPAAVQWFADANAMKLGGGDGWAAKGQPIAAHPVPAFAAPEVIAAIVKAEGQGGSSPPTLPANPAQDAWSLGMLAYLILTDSPLIPAGAAAADVAAALGSSGPLPWEKPGGALEDLADPEAAAAIKGLLRREAKHRASAAQLLGGPLFKGLAAAAAAAGTTGTPRRK
jgi:serine/threonine protein kinase